MVAASGLTSVVFSGLYKASHAANSIVQEVLKQALESAVKHGLWLDELIKCVSGSSACHGLLS